MEVVLAAVADHASVTGEGKLNLLGIFDSIRGPRLPIVHQHMVFAFRLRIEYEDELKEHLVDVRLLDQDGAVLFNAQARLRVSKIAPGQFVHGNQIMELNNVQFEKPGRYRFRIEVKGKKAPHDTVFQVLATQQ